ncbi:MAG: DUF1295 domain-containing protein [Deltaproteobacteria bacterium]|nr:DUF1295 domain-containing protein [Deltaproteobacteria bacterium]
MDELAFFPILAWTWMGIAGLTFIVLLFVTAPYGRFARDGWGARMSNRLGWIVQEAPASLGFLAFFLLGDRHAETVPLALLAFWQIHYVHRAFVFPFRLRGERRQTTVLTVSLAVLFNLGNTYLNARYIYSLGPGYDAAWLVDPRFLIGAVLFWSGFAINKHADAVLVRLRRPGETGYKIPRGGLYRYISSPNYLGEMVQWGGWALMCWNLGGLAFFVWTVANLAPRALAVHRWYQRTFADYPLERKALLPFLV